MKIKKLPDYVINKISAGEVINSPSDVIKELIENSIDANSSEITIQVKGKGLSFIKIKDNGEGIEKEDLLNITKKNWTSKLSNFEDLFNLKTFGFRGEALHSISNVSRMIIRSSIDGIEGYEAKFESGNLIDFRNCYCNKGTTIIVKDLFFNVPIRRNFLSSSKTEMKKIKNVILNYVLAFEWITFKLNLSNKHLVFEKTNNRDERIKMIFGGFQKKVLRTSEFSLELYIFDKSIENRIFVNLRPVVDNKISQILSKLNYIIFINVNPKDVDVNVHPKKLEVKFSKNINIYNELKKFISESKDIKIKPKYIQISNQSKIENKPKFITTISKNSILIIHRERALRKIYFQKLLSKQYKTQMLTFPYTFKIKLPDESLKILKVYGFSVIAKENEIIINGIPDIIESLNYEDMESILKSLDNKKHAFEVEAFLNEVLEIAVKYSKLSDDEIILKLLFLKNPNFDHNNRRIIYEIDLNEIENKF